MHTPAVREIDAREVEEAVARLCVQANCVLGDDVACAISAAREKETWPRAKEVLGSIEDNIRIAADEQLPACQDTGAACVFVELGQDVHVVGGGLREAVDAGVARGYTDGYLRKSMLADPLRRENTNDNTPAFLHVDLVAGDTLRIVVAPKGAGSENWSRVGMLKPADGQEGVERFVLDAVRAAGPNPCPPVVVGVGIGGNFDVVAHLAKKALLRPVGTPSPDALYADMEARLLAQVNTQGTGPAGFGGQTTALSVAVEAAPTHIAMLPVAVCLNCHVARHAEVVL